MYLHDIFPTLCDLIGTNTPDSVEGTSLVSALNNGDEQVRDTIFSAYREWQRMVKDNRFKLIEYAVNGRRTTQLFDLKNDPLELHNLADDQAHAGKVADLRETLYQWRDDWGRREKRMGKNILGSVLKTSGKEKEDRIMEWEPIFHDFTFGESGTPRNGPRRTHCNSRLARQMRDGYPRNTKNAAFAAPRDY